MEDFRCAADYLVTLPYVDEDRIGVFGMCGGGGYTWTAAMTERRFKAVATVTGVNVGRLMREGDMSPDAAIQTLEAIAKQHTAEAGGAERRVDNFLPPSPEKATELGLVPPWHIGMAEATEYYKTPRGAAPNGTNLSLFSSMAATVGYDAYHLAEYLLTQPLMLVVGNKPGEFGAYRDAYTVFDRARSRDKRRCPPLLQRLPRPTRSTKHSPTCPVGTLKQSRSMPTRDGRCLPLRASFRRQDVARNAHGAHHAHPLNPQFSDPSQQAPKSPHTPHDAS
ncbi:alpha/beta hydrolase [Streptomyces sp. NPDC004549]|uniref:alpha/beta hydrolase n=1 Tax=Streptomyces sp. NPDC004549 TaxID=3154283 RepID=UPI0033A7718D